MADSPPPSSPPPSPPAALPPFGQRAFTPGEQRRIQHLLTLKIPRSATKVRSGHGGSKLTYISHDTAVNIMNGVFGSTNTQVAIQSLKPDFMDPVEAGNVQNRRICAGIACQMRITLKNGAFREDVGYGLASNMPKDMACEKAYKEAVSDATKRCLRTFGPALGMCLYDKQFLEKELMTTPAEQQTEANGWLPPDIVKGIFTEVDEGKKLKENGLKKKAAAEEEEEEVEERAVKRAKVEPPAVVAPPQPKAAAAHPVAAARVTSVDVGDESNLACEDTKPTQAKSAIDSDIEFYLNYM